MHTQVPNALTVSALLVELREPCGLKKRPAMVTAQSGCVSQNAQLASPLSGSRSTHSQTPALNAQAPLITLIRWFRPCGTGMQMRRILKISVSNVPRLRLR